MAKNPKDASSLTFVEIVMRADADTIKAAWEARTAIDALLAEREEAYQRIAQLEEQVETVLGEPGVFVFPAPPYPVAGFQSAAAKPKPATPKDRPPSLKPGKPGAAAEADADGDADGAGPQSAADASGPQASSV